MTTCKLCDAELEFMGAEVGWVDTLSGDEGGTYDHCPENGTDEDLDGPGHVASTGGE